MSRSGIVAWLFESHLSHMCSNHMQHIERLSHATCHVACHIVQRDSSAIEFDRIEIAFIFSSILLTDPLTDERGEEHGVPGENPW